MILFWKVRYLDRADRKFKDRNLYLDTASLDPLTNASVELCYELNESGASRDMLKHRHLFIDKEMTVEEQASLCGHEGFGCVYFLRDYFEDESGKELSNTELAQLLTGSSDAIAIPPGAKQHDIDYMLARPSPIQVEKMSASEQDLKVLGYFVRDLRELENSAFRKEGPGRLTWSPGSEQVLQTAVSDEEIRSFVTVFRRLYMANEPASFLTVVMLFAQLIGDYPLVRWVAGVGQEYEGALNTKPDFAPFDDRDQWTFTRKRLIDVFIYTQYAHQPSEQRIRQFQECLEQVSNKRQKLTWLFLTEIWQASLQIISAGRQIARVYEAYCNYWGKWPDLLDSVANDTPGLGQLETKENKRQRVFSARAEALSFQLWEEGGRPEGGPAEFLKQAYDALNNSLS